MVEKSRNERNVSRRNALKVGAGSLIGLSGIAGFSSALTEQSLFEKFEKKIEIADRIAEQQGPKARAEWLEKKGVQTEMVRGVYKNPNPDFEKKTEDNDGASTQRVDCVQPNLCDGDIDLTLTRSYDSNSKIIDVSNTMRLHYRAYWSDLGVFLIPSGGENPADGISFSWKEGTFKLIDKNQITNSVHSGPHQWWDNGSWNGEGLVMKANDYKMCTASGSTGNNWDWTPYETCGVFLKTGSNFSSGDDIVSGYQHSWNSGSISYGISYPWGWSVSYSGGVKTQDLQTDLYGNTLRVQHWY